MKIVILHVDFSNFNSLLINMSEMFNGCSFLQSINLSSFNILDYLKNVLFGIS